MEGLTPQFITTIPEHYGSVGVRWLENIDTHAQRFMRKWQLERLVEAPMMGGCALVIPCRNHKGQERILKLCPDPYLLAREHDGLRHWHSSGKTVRVRRGDGTGGAVLLERLRGVSPTSLDQDILMEVAEVIDAIHGAPGELPAMSAQQHISSAIMATCIGRLSVPYVAELVSTDDVKQAIDAALALSISADPADQAVLHGDLHLGNMIQDRDRGLIAFDPKPFVAERAVEVALLVRDAGPVYELLSRIERASAACAVDAERTHAWTRVVLLDTAVSHARKRKSSRESIETMVEFCRSGRLRG